MTHFHAIIRTHFKYIDVEELDPEVEELEVADVSAGGGVPPTELIFDVRTVRKVPWK